MIKKLLLSSATCFLLLTAAFSQTTNKVKAPNEDHDRLFYMLYNSRNIILPDSMINALKLYGINKGFPESYVLKNTCALQVIYNPAISKDDKIFMCNYCLDIFKEPYEYLPRTIFSNMIKNLESNK